MKDWAKLLQETLTDSIEPVPKGWKTAKQIANELGKSGVRTGELLRQWVEMGKAERKNFKVKTGQRVLPVPHYRVKA